jgi:hypothetical protein
VGVEVIPPAKSARPRNFRIRLTGESPLSTVGIDASSAARPGGTASSDSEADNQADGRCAPEPERRPKTAAGVGALADPRRSDAFDGCERSISAGADTSSTPQWTPEEIALDREERAAIQAEGRGGQFSEAEVQGR